MKIVAILVSLVYVECVPKYTLYLMAIAPIVKFCMQGPRYFHFNTVAWLFVIFLLSTTNHLMFVLSFRCNAKSALVSFILLRRIAKSIAAPVWLIVV